MLSSVYSSAARPVVYVRGLVFGRFLSAMILSAVCLGAVPTTGVAQEAKPDHAVALTNIEFKPNRLHVKVGDTIRFTNKDKFDHDVYLVRTANRNDVMLPATTIHAGGSVTVTIDQEGLFTLYCTIHGGMTAKITTTGTFELTEEEKKRAAARKVIPPIVKVGEELYWGHGQCHRCHMMGERGKNLRGPNHQDLGFRAGARAQKFGLSSGTEYIVQSILEPSAHIVEGYSDDMPKVYQPPINLTKDDITALVAYLQSQGGEVDTWSINLNAQTLATPLEPSPFRHGDVARGEKVFLDMGCRSCHTVGDRPGLSVAPDLTAIGAYRNWTWLASSIIDPSAEVGANWRDATVYLKPGVTVPTDQSFESDEDFDEEEFSDDAVDTAAAAPDELAAAREALQKLQAHIAELEAKGAVALPGDTPSGQAARPTSQVSTADAADANADASADADEDFEYGESVPGVLRENSADHVTLLIGPDRFATFPRDQVVRVKMSAGSRMASNYGELMTFQQLADLIQYLESLKGTDQDSVAVQGTPDAQHAASHLSGAH